MEKVAIAGFSGSVESGEKVWKPGGGSVAGQNRGSRGELTRRTGVFKAVGMQGETILSPSAEGGQGFGRILCRRAGASASGAVPCAPCPG